MSDIAYDIEVHRAESLVLPITLKDEAGVEQDISQAIVRFCVKDVETVVTPTAHPTNIKGRLLTLTPAFIALLGTKAREYYLSIAFGSGQPEVLLEGMITARGFSRD